MARIVGPGPAIGVWFFGIFCRPCKTVTKVILRGKTAPKFDPDQTFASETVGAINGPVLAVTDQFPDPDVECMSVAARTIIELNIKHYRDLLRSETDASKQQTIAKLLADEEAKLAKLVAGQDRDK